MGFEQLLLRPDTEKSLLEYAIAHIQSEYFAHQNLYYFIKLDRVYGSKTQLSWIKMFSNKGDYRDFFYNSKYKRACLLIKFESGHYEALWSGFEFYDHFAIYPSCTADHRPLQVTYDPETIPMLPKELASGFSEIREQLTYIKSNKPI